MLSSRTHTYTGAAALPLHKLVLGHTPLHGLEELQYGFLPHAGPQTGAHEVPQTETNAPGAPVPDIGSAAAVGVGAEQTCRKLVFKFRWEGSEDRGVCAGEFAAVREGCKTVGGATDVFAADDKEGFLDVVNFNWSCGDATLVDKWRGAAGACDAIEDERLGVPIQEPVLRGSASGAGAGGEAEIGRGRREPKCLEYAVERGNRLMLAGDGGEGVEMGLEGLLDGGAGGGDGVGSGEGSEQGSEEGIGVGAGKDRPVVGSGAWALEIWVNGQLVRELLLRPWRRLHNLARK